MIERIVKALEKCGISRWRINETSEESAELFFVKHTLDQRRIKQTHKYAVTVFRTEEKNGKKFVGSTVASLIFSIGDGELESALKDAYFAAQYALNPYFEAPEAVKAEKINKTGAIAGKTAEESAGIMATALFAADTNGKSFINSAEIFCHKTDSRIISSEGTDVSFTDACIKGEYVSQCKEPEDVELFDQFTYGDLETEALTKRVGEQLTYAVDRARAQSILKSGKYNVLLTDGNLAEVLIYYVEKTSAAMIYPRYSTWKTGDDIQGDTSGEKVSISLAPTLPYSGDGIPMNGLNILRDGKVTGIHGPTNFCRYLGIKPTGVYEKFVCDNKGTASFEEMKNTPCILPVMFSDFKIDEMDGHFGGEIRLAYLIENGKITPVTGGSVNGSIFDCQKNLRFSTERYVSAGYEGPRACMLTEVSVAGTVKEQ